MSGGAQDVLMLTKTGMAMAVPAIVAATLRLCYGMADKLYEQL